MPASLCASMSTAPDLAQLAERSIALRERLKAAGVVAISRSIASFSLVDWFVAVLREVSHDLPVHAAVWGTGHERFDVDPLLFGDPEALDRCRILAIAERQDRVAEALEGPSREATDSLRKVQPHLGIDVEPMPTFAWPGPGQPRAADPGAGAGSRCAPGPGARTAQPRVRCRIGRRRRHRPRAHPTGGRDRRGARAALDPGERLAPRCAGVTARSLAPGKWNLLGVYVAPSDVALAGAVFPEQAVDFSHGDVVVSVQVELSGAQVTSLDATDLKWMFGGELRPGDMRDGGERSGQLLRGPLAKLPVESDGTSGSSIVGLAATTMILPPAGDSTLAFFAVLPAHEKAVEGRIAIIHKNRVVQTARLSVGVDTAAAGGTGLDVVAEAAIYPRDDDLDERRDYDVAIQLSDVGGKLHLKVHHDGRDVPVQLDALQGPIGRIQTGTRERRAGVGLLAAGPEAADPRIEPADARGGRQRARAAPAQDLRRRDRSLGTHSSRAVHEGVPAARVRLRRATAADGCNALPEPAGRPGARWLRRRTRLRRCARALPQLEGRTLPVPDALLGLPPTHRAQWRASTGGRRSGGNTVRRCRHAEPASLRQGGRLAVRGEPARVSLRGRPHGPGVRARGTGQGARRARRRRYPR